MPYAVILFIEFMLSKISVLLEMIKFEHTVFALPFAFMGAFLAQRGFPEIIDSAPFVDS